MRPQSQQLASRITRAQAIIDNPASSSSELANAGLFEELATGQLAGESPPARQATLAALHGAAASSMRTDLAASAALSKITPTRKRLPAWRIIQPPSAQTLLGYYRAAQARFGVPWEYLAAIELIETHFGRVVGLSSAGARGPMQFLPSTWSEYGSGKIDNQRDAIFAAARYLVANGAPHDMPDALYHYNNSSDYVRAVQAYASWMRADTLAYAGYYGWQVLYPLGRRTVLLPVGYPKARSSRVNVSLK